MATNVISYMLLKMRMKKALSEADKKQLFDELISTYYDKAFNFAYTMTFRNREEAEDLVKEAFLRAWKFFDKYDPEKPFDNWLMTIMRNVQIDRVRRHPAFTEKSVDEDVYDTGTERYNFADENQQPVEENVAEKDYGEK